MSSSPSPARAAFRLWHLVTSIATTVGLLTATAQWGAGTCAGVFLAAGMCAGCLAAATGPTRPGRLLRVAIVSGCLVAGAAGLVELLGSFSLLVILPVAATAPDLWSRIRVWRILAGGPSTDHSPAGTPVAPEVRSPSDLERHLPGLVAALAMLDDTELCLAWRRSFVLLTQAVSPQEKLVVVALRERYLDELERRSPSGIDRWLGSGARASGNPLPYLDDRPRS